jgi:hypothetical protein
MCIAFERENIDFGRPGIRGLGKRRLRRIIDHEIALG